MNTGPAHTTNTEVDTHNDHSLPNTDPTGPKIQSVAFFHMTPSGARQEVLDVQQTTLNPLELLDSPQDWPVLIPSYALGNLTELVVLPDQSFQIPNSVMGVQHLSTFGKATARELVGLNGIRTVDPEEAQIAITLIFEEETIVSCAHGGLAVCDGAQDVSQSTRPAKSRIHWVPHDDTLFPPMHRIRPN